MGAFLAFPSETDRTPEQGVDLTEDQWRPALESGELPNEGWLGRFNPPVGSAGPGLSLPSYSAAEAAVFTEDSHARGDIQAGFDRRAAYKPPPLPKARFSSEEERAEMAKQIAIGELLPLLPESVVSKLLDGAGTDTLTREEAVRERLSPAWRIRQGQRERT